MWLVLCYVRRLVVMQVSDVACALLCSPFSGHAGERCGLWISSLAFLCSSSFLFVIQFPSCFTLYLTNVHVGNLRCC